MSLQHLQRTAGFVATILLTNLILLAAPSSINGASLSDQVSSAADQTSQTLDNAGKAAASKLEQLWRKIDEARLKNRTRDEIVAWVLMGLLVGGALANFMGVNRAGAFALGLLGAFIGGIIVHVSSIDLGLGPVLIRYEDLLFSLAGSLLVVFVFRMLMKRRKKRVN